MRNTVERNWVEPQARQNCGNRAADAIRSLYDRMPASDPASRTIEGILAVVPASRWTFGRIDAKGAIAGCFSSHSTAPQSARLADELARQRALTPNGPVVSAMRGPLDNFTTGVSLVFADSRASYGILTLVRAAELGPFTCSEMNMLTFAADTLCERLSKLHSASPARRNAAPPEIDASEPPEGAFYVLDRDFQIILAGNAEDQRRIPSTVGRSEIGRRLPRVLETSVRELTAAWSTETIPQAGIARPVPFLVVRTQPLSGSSGTYIGVRIERSYSPASLTNATARYHISPRETQVLELLLDGNTLDEIANQLHIAPSTAQDHIKNMLDKTGSTNRCELIARVFGWQPKAKVLGA